MLSTVRLSVISAVSFVLVLMANGLANIIPLGGKTTGEISDLYPNLFVPTGFTFAIWGLIYTLLGVMVVYQLVSVWRGGAREETEYVTRMGYLFAISNLANAGWIVAWHYQQVFISLLLILSLFLVLARLYLLLHQPSATYRSRVERLVVQLPFRVYFGWVSVALIANVTAVLVDSGWGRWGLSEVFWTLAMLMAATVVGLLVLARRKDIAFVAVVVWALGGIAFRHLASEPALPSVGWAALSGCVILVLAIGASFTTAQRRSLVGR